MSPFIDLKDVPEIEPFPGFRVKFTHTDNCTQADWTIAEGAVLPEHSHFHEQIARVVEGKFELTIEGETKILEKGTVAIIPSNAVHSGKAHTSCKIQDTFFPRREDYMKMYPQKS